MSIKRLQRYDVAPGWDLTDPTGDYCLSSDVTELEATNVELVKALEGFLEMYCQGVNCGDWGNWDPEEEDEVIAARKALASARGSNHDS